MAKTKMQRMQKRGGTRKTGSSARGATRASPRHRDFKQRLEVLTKFAVQMRVDCTAELENTGGDPIAGIGVLAHALGLDVISVLNPATNLDDLIANRRP